MVHPQAVTLDPERRLLGHQPQSSAALRRVQRQHGLTTALTAGEAQWGWTFIPDYEDTYIAKDPENNHQVAGGASAWTCST